MRYTFEVTGRDMSDVLNQAWSRIRDFDGTEDWAKWKIQSIAVETGDVASTMDRDDIILNYRAEIRAFISHENALIP